MQIQAFSALNRFGQNHLKDLDLSTVIPGRIVSVGRDGKVKPYVGQVAKPQPEWDHFEPKGAKQKAHFHKS